MLVELLKGLRDAKTDQEREEYYLSLEQVGMDRTTANFILINMKLGGYDE